MLSNRGALLPHGSSSLNVRRNNDENATAVIGKNIQTNGNEDGVPLKTPGASTVKRKSNRRAFGDISNRKPTERKGLLSVPSTAPVKSVAFAKTPVVNSSKKLAIPADNKTRNELLSSRPGLEDSNLKQRTTANEGQSLSTKKKAVSFADPDSSFVDDIEMPAGPLWGEASSFFDDDGELVDPFLDEIKAAREEMKVFNKESHRELLEWRDQEEKREMAEWENHIEEIFTKEAGEFYRSSRVVVNPTCAHSFLHFPH